MKKFHIIGMLWHSNAVVSNNMMPANILRADTDFHWLSENMIGSRKNQWAQNI